LWFVTSCSDMIGYQQRPLFETRDFVNIGIKFLKLTIGGN